MRTLFETSKILLMRKDSNILAILGSCLDQRELCLKVRVHTSNKIGN